MTESKPPRRRKLPRVTGFFVKTSGTQHYCSTVLPNLAASRTKEPLSLLWLTQSEPLISRGFGSSFNRPPFAATMSKVHCLEYEPEDGSAPSPAAAAPAVDPAPPPQPSSRRRRSSILKKNTTDSSDDEAVTSSADRPTTHRRRVSFTSVDIAEHDLTLGDHPDCSYGPPTALDWKPIRRHSIDLEEFEGSRCKESGNNPRLWTKKRTVILTHQQRINALKKAGYSDKEIEKATNKKIWAKNLRSITRSYANTPVDKAEEVLSSVSRKFKKVVKITPSSKKNQPTFSVKDLKDDSSSSTKKVTVETPTMESVAPASA